MHRLILLALCAPIALTTTACLANPGSTLFQLVVKELATEDRKELNLTFSEVARGEASSTVLVTRESGGSVSSSMFVLRGMCGLARARGKNNFLPTPLPEQQGGYIVTFPDTPPPKDKGFSIAQCDLLRY